MAKFYAHMHTGECIEFEGQCWEDGGFSTDADGNPKCDHRGNTVAKFSVESRTIRDEVIEVLRDGSRDDRFLEIVCDGSMPSDLFLTTQNTAVDDAQFRVPALLDTTPEQEEAEADAVIDAAIAFLAKQS